MWAFTPASRSRRSASRSAAATVGQGARRGDGGAEGGGEALGLLGRVGADPLQRHAVGARELA